LIDEDNQNNEPITTRKITATLTTTKSITTAATLISLIGLADLKCSKNVDSISIISFINCAYFVICLLIYILLILNSVLIYMKLKEKPSEFNHLFKVDAVESQEILNGNKKSSRIDTMYSNILVATNNSDNELEVCLPFFLSIIKIRACRTVSWLNQLLTDF
jgi:uncharacterized protein with PQ loop repeat